MEKTLLWEAFATLEKTEWRAFDKFLRSPYFNQKERLIALAAYLWHCCAQNAPPQQESAWAATWPESGPYDDQKMRLAGSELLALLERFWAVRAFEEDKLKVKTQIATVYRKRKLGRHFSSSLRAAEKACENRPYRDRAYYRLRYDQQLEEFQFASAANRYKAFNLQDISDGLDLDYVICKLQHVCMALSHAAVYPTAYDFGPLEAVYALVESRDWIKLPAVALYYHAARFLSHVDAERHFALFRDCLSASSALFPHEELRILYLFAINFSIRKGNETGERWGRETLNLYKEALALRLLLEDGILSRFAYNNIAGMAIRLGDVAWAEQFIETYQSYVEKRYREGAYALNVARTAYVKKEYGRALTYLQMADYKDFISGMTAKLIQMKVYYDQAEFDLLESHLDSIQIYLRRQEAVGYHRDNYQAIVRFTRALARCNPNDKSATEALRAAVEATPTLTERAWLLERIAAL